MYMRLSCIAGLHTHDESLGTPFENRSKAGMMAVTAGIRALGGRQAVPSSPQAQATLEIPKRIPTAGRAGAKIVRALVLFVATWVISQIHVIRPLFCGPSVHGIESISQLSVGRVADRNQLPTFGRLASHVFRPATRLWRAETFYQRWPVSQYRPSGQFYVRPLATELDVPPAFNLSSDRPPHAQVPAPVITIVTATRNPSELFFTRTVQFVLEQSLQSFRWVIVNDHSTEMSSIRRLADLKRWAEHREPFRILIVDNPSSVKQGNGPAAMNYGLRFVGASPFVAILDDDDMWELTSLEKAALVMSWVPDAYAVSFDVVNHGDKKFLWKRGFHNGDESFFHGNNMMQGSPFRSSVLAKCRFREDMADGGADWDFWMCMASHGMWGLHLPENGNWYQWNPPSFRKKRWKAVATPRAVNETRGRIQRRYPKLINEDAWPPMVLPPSFLTGQTLAIVNERVLFTNSVGLKGAAVHERRYKRDEPTNISTLLVLKDLGDPDVSARTVQVTRELAGAGWRVTVVLTHYRDADEDTAMHDHHQFLQYTHDVFVAGTVAPLGMMPDLVDYLIESRGIGVVFVPSEHSTPHVITRCLVAAAITVQGTRATERIGDRQRPTSIAVIDAGPRNERFECKDGEGDDHNDACYAKAPEPRDAVWFALIEPSHDPVQNLQTKQCWIRRGYANVIVPGDGSVTLRYANTIAAARRAAAALFTPDQDDLARDSETNVWSAFLEHHNKKHNPASQRLGRGMDMRQIQRALQYRKQRHGFGRQVQLACPERVYANSRWIDALEAPLSCDQGGGPLRSQALDVAALRANALRQCGAWCVANLDGHASADAVRGSVLGWKFSGTCFRPILSLNASFNCLDEIARARGHNARVL